MLSLLLAQTPLPYTTVLANDIQYGVIDVRGQQEPTYNLEVEPIIPTSIRTITSPEDVAYHTVTGHTPQLEDIPTQQEVIDKIIKAFPDALIMVEIARCESTLDPTADRAGLGVDVGLFQINQVHLAELNLLGLDRRNIDDNITFARLLYDRAGTQPWYMSEYCWGKYYA